MLSFVNLYTREFAVLVPAIRLRADDVVATLSRLREERGIPATIQCDNRPEFTSVAHDHCATGNRRASTSVDPASRPTTPPLRAFTTAFDMSTQYDFIELTDAQQTIKQYQLEYNNNRPHSSLGNVPPAHIRASVVITASVSDTA